MARPQPRTKGGGVPPPLRPKDMSKLQKKAHHAVQENGNIHSNGNVVAENEDSGRHRRASAPSSTRLLVQSKKALLSFLATTFAVGGFILAPVGLGLAREVGNWLLPWGYPAVPSERLRYAPIDPTNDALQVQHHRLYRIVERLEAQGTLKELGMGTGTDTEPSSAQAPRLAPLPLPLLKAPETILFDPKGNLLIMTEESQLVMLSDFQQVQGTVVTRPSNVSSVSSNANAVDTRTVAAASTYVRDLGPGRPLGGAFGHGKFANTLYIADAVLGLTRIRDYRDPSSKVEIVASSVEVPDEGVDDFGGTHHAKGRRPAPPQPRQRRRRFKYVDDVAVGRRTNKVYFTDASSVAPDRVFRHDGVDGVDGQRRNGRDRGASWTWDTLHGSKLDLLLGAADGRVYEYDPFTDRIRELGRGLRFANGISVDPTERFLVVAETFGPRIHRYWLRGDKAGQWEVMVDSDKLPGYPDGVDCEPTGALCYAVLPSSIVPLHKVLSLLPRWLDRLVRTVLLMVPRQLVPPTQPYAGVVVMNTETGTSELVQDPTGRDVSMLCGVTYHKGRLYLGSVHNSYIAVYETGEPKGK